MSNLKLKKNGPKFRLVLGEHPDYRAYAQHILGHSPQTVADRHYVAISQARFDEAIDWLGSALGIPQLDHHADQQSV